MLFEVLPALEIFTLQLRCFQRKLRRLDDGRRLEHEGHGIGHLAGPAGVGRAGFRERVRIRSVAGHAVVQAGAARHEAFGLGIIGAVDQAHELAGHIAMKPRRAKSVFSS